ncbi:MAG TPA: GtrA family protein, partial [Armatimonadota bacterium]|nr:GtrA family protein [Armatimonadota bacterium]
PTHALGGHHIGTILATIIAYMLGNIVQYLLSHYWVFADNSANRLLSFIPFTVLALVGLLITTGVVELLYGMFHWDILLAKSCALILAFIWNFTSRRMLIFRQTVLPPTVQKQHIP